MSSARGVLWGEGTMKFIIALSILLSRLILDFIKLVDAADVLKTWHGYHMITCDNQPKKVQKIYQWPLINKLIVPMRKCYFHGSWHLGYVD